MKTAHQFARELLALPDITILHFDPSLIVDEESPYALTEPVAELNEPEGDPEEDGGPLVPFISICGNVGNDEDEYGERAWRILRELERDPEMLKRIEEVNAKLDSDDDEQYAKDNARPEQFGDAPQCGSGE